MSFILNEQVRAAYEISDEVIQNISYSPEEMIDTSAVVDYVRKRYFPELALFSRSFAGLSMPSGACSNSGAKLRVDLSGPVRKATIVLNSDMPPTYQRFCLMQQLGHLATLPADAKLDPDSYNVSTQINYDIAGISEADLDGNYYLLREQVANIFALRVLMPAAQFYRKMRELNSVTAAARFFGLTEDAVISRMMIGA